jgi:hypothetical protein
MLFGKRFAMWYEHHQDVFELTRAMIGCAALTLLGIYGYLH